MLNGWNELEPYSRLVNTEGIEPRAYQINIAKSIYNGGNTLVVLPTGLGKTFIAVLAIAYVLHHAKKAIFLAPTKPLSEQHYNTMLKLLNIDPKLVLLLTGSLPHSKRLELEQQAKVIIGTPQTVANDLKKATLSLEETGIVIFDECHKAVGKYAYTYIANECKLRGVQMIGLTASPGSDRKKINTLVETLGISNIEIRISTDYDVAPYVMKKDTNIVYIEKSRTIEEIGSLLKPVIDEHLQALYNTGLSRFKNFENMPKGRLLEIGDYISKLEARNYRFMAIYHYSYVLHLAHAYDLITTEGISPFMAYMRSLDEKATKSKNIKGILANSAVSTARHIAANAETTGEEHPKMTMLANLLGNEFRDQNVIVFAQYRSTIKKIVEVLLNNGITAHAFVGKKYGVTQAQQQSIIEDFRKSKFRVLVTTSIGEEGLDIPAVDMVIFYEPIPSEIRNIQRKGRAGRLKYGRVVILVTLGTRDEAYLMISRIREKRMYDNVVKIKEHLLLGHAGKVEKQQKLG
ncbi:MAG: DEAD/DEAH box helicase [Candidatus Micrarchaeia archaeon]